MVLSQVQNETIYHAIQETHDETGCSISELRVFAGIPRSSYYKWLNRKEGKNEQFNSQLLPRIKEAYEGKNGILGYRQMTIKLNRENDFHVNQKRIYRLMPDFRFEIRMPQEKEKLYKIHSSGDCRKCVEQGIYS